MELEAKIVVLEDLIKSKDEQILKLMDRISEIEKKEFTNNFNDDYSDDDDEESETLSGSEFCNLESEACTSRLSHISSGITVIVVISQLNLRLVLRFTNLRLINTSAEIAMYISRMKSSLSDTNQQKLYLQI